MTKDDDIRTASPLIPNDLASRMKKNLVENIRANDAGRDVDHVPVVRLFVPGTPFRWLLTELYDDESAAFGLGWGPSLNHPTYDFWDLRSIAALSIERDQEFNRSQKNGEADAGRYLYQFAEGVTTEPPTIGYVG
jgi:hypothetical protein